MFLVIAMGKILCYDNCMMKNILKNKKFLENYLYSCNHCIYSKNLFIGADTDEGYGIMVGYRLAMGDRLLLEMWEPHQTSAILRQFYQAVCDADRWRNYLNLFYGSYFSQSRRASASFYIRRSAGRCRRWMRMWQH